MFFIPWPGEVSVDVGDEHIEYVFMLLIEHYLEETSFMQH